VIIPTRDAARTLELTLTALDRQTRRAERIVIVDSDSKDATRDIASRHNIAMFISTSGRENAAQARNLGVSASREDYLFFVDADQEASPTLIEDCATRLDAGSDAVVVGETTTGAGFVAKMRQWERSRTQAEPSLVFARAVRRTSFEGLGGFDSDMTGFEDLDFQARITEAGYKIGVSPERFIHHEEWIDFASYMRKRLRYMSDWPRFREKHPRTADQIGSPLSRMTLYVANLRGPSDLFWLAAAASTRIVEISFARSARLRSRSHRTRPVLQR
jgi:glycosyltransferase involved in cell wall biosynthesis